MKFLRNQSNKPTEMLSPVDASIRVSTLSKELIAILDVVPCDVETGKDTRFHRIQISSKVQQLMTIIKAVEAWKIQNLITDNPDNH